MGDRLHLGQQVGRQHDGVILTQLAQHTERFLLLAGVKAVGRLIEDQQGRISDQSVGQTDALAEALRQRTEQGAAHALQPAAVDAVGDAPRPTVALDALNLGPVIEIFIDAHFAIERNTLRQVADAFADFQRVFHHVKSIHLDDAAGRRQIGGEDAHDRGLAGAVVAEQADDLVLFDLETDVADGQDVAEVFGQSFDVDHGSCQPGCGLMARQKKPPSFPRSAWERKDATLCVAPSVHRGRDAERPDARSHAERGNEGELVF